MDGGLSLRDGTVTAVLGGWPGVQEVEIAFSDGRREKAIVYLDLLPPIREGEGCLVNTTALELDLGTGGYHIVVSHGRAPVTQPTAGHLMKLRYTPFQVKVAGPEDPDDPRHRLLEDARDLEGMPIVAVELHSQIAPVAAAFRCVCPEGRLAYVMTDQGSLVYRLSRLAQDLRRGGFLVGAVTSGQAFGGDLEASTVHSGLLLARRILEADAVVVGIGPGLLGTGTPFGHGGVAQGEALNAALALGGRAVAVPRVSQAEARTRHRGVSHHTEAVLQRVVLRPVTVPLPRGLPPSISTRLKELSGPGHTFLAETVPEGWRDLLLQAGVEVRSMGRTYDEDPLFFDAAAAGGALIGRWVREDG